MEPVLLVRYGEIGLKGRNRPFFIDTLTHNLAVRAGDGVSVRPHFGRIVISRHGGPLDADLIAHARRTFGVVSVSPAVRAPASLEAILSVAAAVTGEALRARPIRSFKVDTRRADKRFVHDSLVMNTLVGRHLQDRYPLAVNLHDPDLTVTVEIRDVAYVYAEVLPGPGGLPVGTGGRVLALLSGGIDSPVAAWMAARRGLVVTPVHFYSFPFVSERSREKVVDLCRVLSRSTGPLRLWSAHFTEIQRAIQVAVPEDFRVTIMRRMMMRVAEALAEREDARGIVTGESVGQVASQTLESLGVIEAATTLPVLRPLIAMDKTEITARARAIGTYDISVLPYEDCCALFVPAHPRTHPTVAEAQAAEQRLSVEALVQESLAASTVVEVSTAETPLLLGAR